MCTGCICTRYLCGIIAALVLRRTIMKRLFALIGCCIFAGGLMGCAVNPVSGKHRLSCVAPEHEVAIGAKKYEPSQQSQGGRYAVHPGLTVYVNQVGKKLAAVSDRPQLPYECVVL